MSDSELEHSPWDSSYAIKHESTVPAYVQLAVIIRAFIIAWQLPTGTSLASEPALSERYGVSRDTVRKAMAVLREMGLTETRRGVGHYVVYCPERVYLRAGPGTKVTARFPMPKEQDELYGGRLGFPVLVVEEPGQPPVVYDSTRTSVSFVDSR